MKKILSRFIILPVVFMLLSIPLAFVAGKALNYSIEGPFMSISLSQRIWFYVAIICLYPIQLLDYMGIYMYNNFLGWVIQVVGWGLLGLLLAYLLHLKDRLTGRSKRAV